jgi:integrase
MPKIAKPLTDTAIEKAKLGPDGRAALSDGLCPGLVLRMSAGKSVWSFLYPVPGTGPKFGNSLVRNRLPLGPYPGVTIKQARIKAEEARGLVANGKDPMAVAGGEVKKNKTVADVFAKRYAEKLTGKGVTPYRTADDILACANTYILPLIGPMSIKNFDDANENFDMDVLSTVWKKCGDREKYAMGNKVFANLRALFTFAKNERYIRANPLAGLELPYDENARERFLLLGELRHFWNTCEQITALSPTARLALKILLASGKRSNEVCGARRSEIDWIKRVWTIPACRIKGRDTKKKKVKEEKVPLSDLLFSLFKEAAQNTNSEFLFPKQTKNTPYTSNALAQALYAALEERANQPLGQLDMEKWTVHDLRRTVGTQLLNSRNGLRVDGQRIHKPTKYLVLNHTSGRGDTETNKVSDDHYDGNEYLDEKLEALQVWGEFVTDLVGDKPSKFIRDLLKKEEEETKSKLKLAA